MKPKKHEPQILLIPISEWNLLIGDDWLELIVNDPGDHPFKELLKRGKSTYKSFEEVLQRFSTEKVVLFEDGKLKNN